MDRKNEIEKLLLSRCSKYNKDGEILKLLEARYSVTGTQKDFLVLEGTKDGGVSVNRDDIKNKNEKKQIKTTKNEIINIGPKSIANTRFRLAVPVQKSGSNSAKDPADVVEDGGDAVEEQLEFEVLGNRVQFRPSERSNKKFKSRSVSDLLV
ncbi:hypothetical protein B5S33_g2196 [[Candida] boidinii]|nr:hypothetical protein B5S30_g1225 [[Candida] boidinii]OWB83565.1 hypothetical protein B5S33_g2196 [[Candida] boidinii]